MRSGALVVAALVVAHAACGLSAVDEGGPGSGSGSDQRCSVALAVSPRDPVAAVRLQITSQVGGGFGVLDYSWRVVVNGAPMSFMQVRPGDNSAIELLAATPGVYTITLDVAGADPPCPEASATINVGAPGALTDFLRLRVEIGRASCRERV